MKKIFLKIPLAFIVVLLVFTSCNVEPEEFDNVLIGSWKYTNYQTGDWEKITFYDDLDYRLSNYNAYYTSTSTYTGTYSYTDTTFTLEQRYSSNIVFKYAVEGDYLYVLPGKTYIRQ